jgi:hypothetical protein
LRALLGAFPQACDVEVRVGGLEDVFVTLTASSELVGVAS